MSSEILNITEGTPSDETIERYEFHAYESVGATYNTTGEIRINIERQDQFIHPANSYILFEGRLLKDDNTAYADANAVALANNGLMHLFSRISYFIKDQQIEAVYHPGKATTMMGMLMYPHDFAVAQGLNQLWAKDTAATIANNTGFVARQALLMQKPAVKGTFSFIVPLSHIFGFCDDYDKVMYGYKQSLIFVRASDNDAIFRDNAVAAGKVELQRIQWFMPHVKPALEAETMLYKTVAAKTNLEAVFRERRCEMFDVPTTTNFSWRLSTSTARPRYIIVAFQTGRQPNQTANPSIFDHCNLRSMHVMLNQDQYPAVDYDLSFPNQQFARAYRAASEFSEKFYGMSPLISQSNINPTEFKDLYPIHVFDLCKQKENLKGSVVDIQIKATFNEAVAANTIAYAVIISDKVAHLIADGSVISVV